MGEREEREKEKKLENTSQLQLQHHQYHQKDLEKINSMTPKKIINGDPNKSHLLQKISEPPATLKFNIKCFYIYIYIQKIQLTIQFFFLFL
jgi:hypothetical protein